MIEQQGQVIAVDGDRISVRLGGRAGCPACDAGNGCGAGLFGRLLNNRPVVLDFENHLGARNGQGVLVGLPERLLLAAAARFYLVPLLLGLGAAAFGHYLSGIAGTGAGARDLAALLMGLVAGALALRSVRSAKWKAPVQSELRLLRLAGPTDPNPLMNEVIQ